MIRFELKHPRANYEMLGLVPEFFDEADPRSAVEQINDPANYGWAGGWHPMPGWRMTSQGITYPGDPMRPFVAEAQLRDEVIRFYAGAYVAIIQPNGDFEVARID